LLLSGSRGGLVAFLAQLVFLVLVTVGTRSRKKLALKVALVVVLFAAIIGGSFFVGGETSPTRIAETAQSKDITTDRAHIWSVTLNVIRNHLPLGAGMGAFGVAYTPYDSYSGLERVEQAHNDYLQVLADAGLVGLVIGAAFLWLIYDTGRRALKVENVYRRGVAAGAFAGIFAILVHSIFDFVLHTTAISLAFLMLLALLVASRSDYADDQEIVLEHGPRERSRSSKGRIARFRK
ncbi:MAG: O-antigen ligase family protein, partial [Pyrinomonadaceae bacterium]|nr:O-antigen ligase family protein [Pyrinomonadaceae bacterium]